MLQLLLDLRQELRGDVARAGQDADGDFRVAHDLLDRAGKGADRALKMVARPQVEVAVSVGLPPRGSERTARV